MGRARAHQWLKANFDRIGAESTVDLDSIMMKNAVANFALSSPGGLLHRNEIRD
jgi:hypothetical protein